MTVADRCVRAIREQAPAVSGARSRPARHPARRSAAVDLDVVPDHQGELGGARVLHRDRALDELDLAEGRLGHPHALAGLGAVRGAVATHHLPAVRTGLHRARRHQLGSLELDHGRRVERAVVAGEDHARVAAGVYRADRAQIVNAHHDLARLARSGGLDLGRHRGGLLLGSGREFRGRRPVQRVIADLGRLGEHVTRGGPMARSGGTGPGAWRGGRTRRGLPAALGEVHDEEDDQDHGDDGRGQVGDHADPAEAARRRRVRRRPGQTRAWRASARGEIIATVARVPWRLEARPDVAICAVPAGNVGLLGIAALGGTGRAGGLAETAGSVAILAVPVLVVARRVIIRLAVAVLGVATRTVAVLAVTRRGIGALARSLAETVVGLSVGVGAGTARAGTARAGAARAGAVRGNAVRGEGGLGETARRGGGRLRSLLRIGLGLVVLGPQAAGRGLRTGHVSRRTRVMNVLAEAALRVVGSGSREALRVDLGLIIMLRRGLPGRAGTARQESALPWCRLAVAVLAVAPLAIAVLAIAVLVVALLAVAVLAVALLAVVVRTGAARTVVPADRGRRAVARFTGRRPVARFTAGPFRAVG